MCGIAAIISNNSSRDQLSAMLRVQAHRGPDSSSIAGNLGHNRLAIIDLSDAGHQPMSNKRLSISFNGEIYNYKELKNELSDHHFTTHTDTEVILAAYEKWGEDCLDKFIGMFAFILWDEHEQKLFAARDRFGVKPLFYAKLDNHTLLFASEIKALIAAGANNEPDIEMWATYFVKGAHELSNKTFIKGVFSLPPGHTLKWRNNTLSINCWYDIAERSGSDFDLRSEQVIIEEYTSLLIDSVKLRFRSDVPVGINLSGGLDSSILLSLSHQVKSNNISAFTFTTGDPDYDELPWVQQMTEHVYQPLADCSLVISELLPENVPVLAQVVQNFQDEPFGGIPTIAYAKLFEQAKSKNYKVLLDGQGMDEQWGGYDYYDENAQSTNLIQGSQSPPLRPDCLTPSFRSHSMTIDIEIPKPFNDTLRNLQYRDIRYTKLPRALRFNDRVSMRSSIELREPFLDHRLVELALRQLPQRKIANGTHKYLLRKIASNLIPDKILLAPKRPVQTPQREWLRGPLRSWANAHIENMLESSNWFDARAIRNEWISFCEGKYDNSFFVWQWISVSLSLCVK